MIICGIADLHGDVSPMQRIFDSVGRMDILLLLGDLTSFGHGPDANIVIEAVRPMARQVLAVAGNCDYHDVEAYLDGAGVGIHRRSVMIDGVGFVGAGKSLPCLDKTPNEASENDFRRFLQEGLSCLPPGIPVVFATHEPPLNTVADIAHVGGHVGSSAIRDFIEKEQPLICFCGHIHEAVGIDSIGITKVVNPGPLREGKFAYAEIEGGAVKILELRSV